MRIYMISHKNMLSNRRVTTEGGGTQIGFESNFGAPIFQSPDYAKNLCCGKLTYNLFFLEGLKNNN